MLYIVIVTRQDTSVPAQAAEHGETIRRSKVERLELSIVTGILWFTFCCFERVVGN